MNPDVNPNLDKIIKKAFKKAGYQKPGPDFVKSVMAKIEKQNMVEKKPIVVSPVISTKGWGLIFLIVVSLISFVHYTKTENKTSILPFDLNIDFSTSSLSVFGSQIFVYGMVIMTIFFLVQIRFAIKKIDKLYEIS
jgi:hypothetical protein